MEKKYTHAVVNTKTGETISKHTNLASAYKKADNSDRRYGATIHTVVPISEGILSSIKNAFKKETQVERMRRLTRERSAQNLGDKAKTKKPGYKNPLEDSGRNPESRSEYIANQHMEEEMNISEKAGHLYDDASEHLSNANDADAEGDKAGYHFHMANYHDSMAEWQDENGRSILADKHAAKADNHHQKHMEYVSGMVKENYRNLTRSNLARSMKKEGDSSLKDATVHKDGNVMRLHSPGHPLHGKEVNYATHSFSGHYMVRHNGETHMIHLPKMKNKPPINEVVMTVEERIKRKYRGTKRGTNETGSPAHRINTKPSVDDGHGTSRYLRQTRRSSDD